jgi:hypothetical protein
LSEKETCEGLVDGILHGAYGVVVDGALCDVKFVEGYKILIAKNVMKQHHAGGSWDFGN